MLTIKKFMLLPDNEQRKYKVVCFPTLDTRMFLEFDVEIHGEDEACLTCGKKDKKMFSLGSREGAKFCPDCFQTLNERSLFYISQTN